MEKVKSASEEKVALGQHGSVIKIEVLKGEPRMRLKSFFHFWDRFLRAKLMFGMHKDYQNLDRSVQGAFLNVF